MGTQSREFSAIQPAFLDLYAGKVLFVLKADEKCRVQNRDVYIHCTMWG